MSKRFVSRVAGSCALSGFLLGVPPAAAFDLAVSGFIRQEAAYRISGDPNPFLRGSAYAVGPLDNTVRGNPVAEATYAALTGQDVTNPASWMLPPEQFFKEDYNKDERWNLMATRAEIDFNMNFTNNLSGFVKVRGYYTADVMDEFGKPNNFEVNMSGVNGDCGNRLEVCGRNYMIDLPSAYLDYTNGPLWIRFGQQQIAWGEAIFFRVADVPNGLDLRRHSFLDFASEEYADERVASPAIRMSYNLNSDWELEAFAQMFQPTIHPRPGTPYAFINSPYAVRDDIGFDNFEDYINAGVRLQGQLGKIHLIGGKPLQFADGNGGVHLGSAAFFFARGRADASNGSRQGDFLHDEMDGVPVSAGFDEGNITLHIGPGRAGLNTGGTIVLWLDTVGDRYGLGEGPVDRLSGLCAHVPFIGKLDRANLFALTAPGTTIFYVARLAADFDLEIADKAADILHLAV